MQMTWPGAPTIYYGDEAGLCGWTDPDNRRTYPWGNEDHELIQYHKDMIKIHKSSKALMEGSIKFLYGSRGFLAYGRFNEDEKWVIVVNINDKPQMTEIPVWEIGVIDSQELVRWIWNHNDGYSLKLPSIPLLKESYAWNFRQNQPWSSRPFDLGRSISENAPSQIKKTLKTTEVYGILITCQDHIMDGFPSGQRGQTVNLLSTTSKVRILLHPYAGVAELADAQDLKSCGTNLPVPVRFRSPA